MTASDSDIMVNICRSDEGPALCGHHNGVSVDNKSQVHDAVLCAPVP
jgi:hypothetical protein